MTTIKSENKTAKIGEVIDHKLNIICNFKTTRLADKIEKLSYAHVLRSRALDDEETEWGIGIQIAKKDVEKLNKDLSIIINRL